MKRISALLAGELSSWPGVTFRPMFGLQAFYRDGVVFAMLPVKRGFESSNGVAYKLGGLKWTTFEVGSEEDVGKALGVLEKAYAQAR